MGWDDVAGKGGSKDQDHIVIAPNTTKSIHILLKPGEEPISYWTHFIPNISGIGQVKGRVVRCPGKDICPACKVGKYRTKRVHAINVWDYDAKAVKILEQGNQVMQQLKMISDQFDCFNKGWDGVDVAIRRVGEKNNTQYMVVVMPRPAPFAEELHGLFPIKQLKIPFTVEEIQNIIDDMERGKPEAPPSSFSVTVDTATSGIPPFPTQDLATTTTDIGSECSGKLIMPFGKYKGKSIQEIAKIDLNYIKWCMENISDEVIKKDCKEVLKLIQGEKGEGKEEEGKDVIVPEEKPPTVSTTSTGVVSEATQKVMAISEIKDIFDNDKRYVSNYNIIVTKMKEASKSAMYPNGKMLLQDYTVEELQRLLNIIK